MNPVAHLDEPIYPAQATLPQESDQLRLHRYSALNASKATEPKAHTIHSEELLPSVDMDELLLYTLTSPSLHFKQTGSSLLIDELSLQHRGTNSYLHSDELLYPAQATLTQESDQLRLHRYSALNASKAIEPKAHTIHSEELLPSVDMDELLLYTLTSPSLHFKQTGSSLLIDELSLQHRGTNSYLHSDELLYPAQATTPQELDQLRPRRHSAIAP